MGHSGLYCLEGSHLGLITLDNNAGGAGYHGP